VRRLRSTKSTARRDYVLGTPPQRGLHATQLVVANCSTQFLSAVLSLSAVYYASQVHKRTVNTGHCLKSPDCVMIVPKMTSG